VLNIEAPVPDAMLGSLVAVPLPVTSPLADARWASLQRRLREQHHFELPVYPGPMKDSWILRISLQAYNNLSQIERLAEVLRNELNAV
jgi:selenocysteine lyase/cysteine desulfurase